MGQVLMVVSLYNVCVQWIYDTTVGKLDAEVTGKRLAFVELTRISIQAVLLSDALMQSSPRTQYFLGLNFKFWIASDVCSASGSGSGPKLYSSQPGFITAAKIRK